MRLFIAVNISSETRNKISRIQSVLKKKYVGVKWTPPENLHLTLKFLGEVDDSGKDLISEKLRQAVVGLKKFGIDFEKIGVFPNETGPRVLWLGIGEGKTGLENLAKKIESLSAETAVACFEKEKKPFSAHLTLGRFKKSETNEKLFDIVKKPPIEKISDAVESVYLMKSILTPRGPVYEVVEKFQLEGK